MAITPLPCDCGGGGEPCPPVATTGLCLADGTPIAVVTTAACEDGTVTQLGWLDLTTGAFTSGPPPAGAVACGSSQSVQVSGTFCDVLPDGTVAGLVLIEYQYDENGAIASVRLVDATTGATYVPTGEITTCPAGVQQPELDLIQLCDVAADGTSTPFVRDFRRDENGVITGHADYTLAGAAYVITGTVGVCGPAGCTNCQTLQLCDVQEEVSAVLPSIGVPTEQWNDLPNGVQWTRRGSDGAMPGGWYQADLVDPEQFDFDRPVGITYRVRFSGPTASPLRIPAGWYLDVLAVGQHVWDPVTRTFSPNASTTQAGESTFRIEATAATSMLAPSITVAQPSGQRSDYGQITVTADVVTPFLRTICRDCDGVVTGAPTDTLLDGQTAYAVLGTVGSCDGHQAAEAECRRCETVDLCDHPLTAQPGLLTGNAASGTLTNGVKWQSFGTGANGTAAFPGARTNADGNWWAIASFPNVQTSPVRWVFDRMVDVEFTVLMLSGDTAPGGDQTQLPPGVEPIGPMPAGYSYDPETRILSVANRPSTPENCATFNPPEADAGVRFRTTAPVISLQVGYLGTRIAICGQFGNYAFGSVEATPAVTPFQRTICRDCDGAVISTTDTLDGRTPFIATGWVGACTATDCCQPETVCLQQNPQQVVEFVSNEAHAIDNSIDPVWKWTPAAPGPASPWYDMYRTNNFGGAWTVTDTDTDRPAWWVSPHPNGSVQQTAPALPNEGPTLGAQHWYARSFFTLPPSADPSTIRVQATVFNADQMATAFRLNAGAWQPVPNANHIGPAYTFGPAPIPGAQAGVNELVLDVNETVPGSGGAGLMVHLIVTYEIARPARRQWTRMLSCDGSFHYLDENGERQDDLPDGWSLAPCGAGGEADPLVLCDDNGTFLRHIMYLADGDVLVSDTAIDGAQYAPVGTVRACAGSGGSGPSTEVDRIVQQLCLTDAGVTTPFLRHWTVDNATGDLTFVEDTELDGETPLGAATGTVGICGASSPPAADAQVNTGVRRLTNSAVGQNLKAEFPGLQSVTLTVLSGSVSATMTDGGLVAVPAGVSLTWSVSDTDDSALSIAAFVGAAASDYLLTWTYKATAAG